MTPLSYSCAMETNDCKSCRLESCGCKCHKTVKRNWKQVLADHNQRRYYLGHGKSGLWYVMDRGTLASPTTRTIATCKNRLDAHRMVAALNKGVK